MEASPRQGRLAAIFFATTVVAVAVIGIMFFLQDRPDIGPLVITPTFTPAATVGPTDVMLTRQALLPRTPTATFVVVTAQPTARDIFEAATRALQVTADARRFGTATATPWSLVTATYTPSPVALTVVTNTPTPVNASTAEYRDRVATAMAVTTGTPTPLPHWVATATREDEGKIVVTAAPPPRDIFDAATRVALVTADAQQFGAATATPENMITATHTPTPLVIMPSPTPANTSTAVFLELLATAQAATTGTPTPLPPWAATPTDPVANKIIVTPAPQPRDVLAAATVAVQGTADARQFGTPTATPPNMITATFTPTPLVIVKTATPGNASTATFRSLVATAIAVTTGTPTPLPSWALMATNTPLPPPTPRPTSTPIWLFLGSVPGANTPTPAPPFPGQLVGRILFLSNMAADGKTRAYAINSDGSGLAQLTADWPYMRAQERDAFSANKAYRAYALKDVNNRVQIFFYDYAAKASVQVSWFGAGLAWLPSWSPTSNAIALVSSESGNDEIWVVENNAWPGRQLTRNNWEWDHHPSWSPDGQQIVFSSNRTGRQQIWLMNADGGNQRPITGMEIDAWDPVWVKYAN